MGDSTESHYYAPLPLVGYPSSLCTACQTGLFSHEGFQKALSDDYDNTAGYCYTRTWAEISLSITKEECAWCTVVKRAREGLHPAVFELDHNVAQIRVQVNIKSKQDLTIYINGHYAVVYEVYAQKGDSCFEDIGRDDQSYSRTEYVNYAKALQLINDCAQHHIHCPVIQDAPLPTRVIDCSNPRNPRLVETRGRSGRYCTLSYVWGADQPGKTVQSNISAYMNKGITLPIPQTIADAINVTFRLGVSYLWVDALCIIQDSAEDQNKELASMGTIYRNAYLSLSVLSAFRAEQGFLPDERVPDVLPFVFPDKGKFPGVMVLKYSIPRPLRQLGKYNTVSQYQPLNERGWCLQESMLAPRKLVFEPPYVCYECRNFDKQDASNRPPLDPDPRDGKRLQIDDYLLFTVAGKRINCIKRIKRIKRTKRIKRIQRMKCIKSIKRIKRIIKRYRQMLRKRWRKTLIDYSGRKITAESDKLVALSSIAEVFQTALSDEYIAGLWKRNLMHDLMWTVRSPMGPNGAHLPRPSKYRAPTWSWASVDGPLSPKSFLFFPPSSDTCYEAGIVECTVFPKVQSLPFGEVENGRLVLSAKMSPLMRDGSTCTLEAEGGEHHGSETLSYSTSWVWTFPAGHCLEPKTMSEGDVRCDLSLDCLEGTEPEYARAYFVLILRAGREWRNEGDWMQGLLLVRADGQAEHYRRVGRLDMIYYDSTWQDWFDEAPLQTVTLI